MDYGRLDECFSITNFFQKPARLQGKKVWLYGFNKETKRTLLDLARLRVPVEGFLLALDERKPSGMTYFGKPVLSKEEFLKMDTGDAFILDVYGDRLQEIWDRFRLRGEALVEVPQAVLEEPVLIYGTGNGGRAVGTLLLRCGIKNFFYCARSDKRRDWMPADCKVLTPDKLYAVDKSISVLIAVWNETDAREIHALLERKGFFRIRHVDPSLFDVQDFIWVRRSDGRYTHAFLCQLGHFLLRVLPEERKEGRSVYFFTNDAACGRHLLATLDTLGLPAAGVATEAVNVCPEDPRVINAYELLYQDPAELFIWALPDDVENARAFLQKSGLPPEIFFFGGAVAMRLNRRYLLDTHLGYADNRGIQTVRNCGPDEPALKVAVLGGSTSDYDLYFMRSWPSWLLELAKNAGIRMECFMAATASYKSAQELIRLLRDVIWMKPDIVISYSGINEWPLMVEQYPLAHKHQKSVFETIVRSPLTPPIHILNANNRFNQQFSMGEPREDDPPACWLAHERMMHAVCQEFGIEFYGILQASLSTKRPRSMAEWELLEYWHQDAGEKAEAEDPAARTMASLADLVERERPNHPWLYNFTDIFNGMQDTVFYDPMHIAGEKNRRIAEKILSIIQTSTRKII